MLTRSCIFSFSTLLLGTSLVQASTMGPVSSRPYRPVVTVFGGVANLSVKSNSNAFVGTDEDIFTYSGKTKSRTAGLVGVFLGTEPHYTYKDFFFQAGLEYNYFGNAYAGGLNTVGIEPEPEIVTLYHYQYTLQTQQLLAVGKLFKTVQLSQMNRTFYPYFSAGLGVAFNRAQNYQLTTAEVDPLNLSPIFANHTNTSFSYNLGVGIDTALNEHARIGVGYKFSDFLKTKLNKGKIIFNQYAYPVSFSLQSPHTYANQFEVHVSYVV